MSNKKPTVPPTPVQKKKSLRFNLGAMVEKTIYATYVKAICEQKGIKGTAAFFSGLLAGYQDWYNTLGVSQEIFDEIQDKLDKEKLKQNAEEFVTTVIQKESRRIILPTGPDGYKLAKEDFDKKLKGKGILD